MAFIKFLIHLLGAASLAFAMTADLPITAIDSVGPVIPTSHSLYPTAPVNNTFISTLTFSTDLESFTIQTSCPSSPPTELPGHRVFTGRPPHLTPPTPSPTEETECIFLTGPRGLVELPVPADVVSVLGAQRTFIPVPPFFPPFEARKDGYGHPHPHGHGPEQAVSITTSAMTVPSLPSSRPTFTTVRTRPSGHVGAG